MIEHSNRDRPKGIAITDTEIDRFAAGASSGRPIAERKANDLFIAERKRAGISFDSVKSPYHDSRQGTLMNGEALHVYRGGHTQEVLDGLTWIHDQILPEVHTHKDLADLTIAGEALPSYLILRAENPVDRMEVPEPVASIFKSSTGLNQYALNTIFVQRNEQIRKPEEVYNAVNASDLFRDGEDVDHTCAGPKGIVVKSTNALLFGEGGNSQNSVLTELIPEDEVGDLLAYSRLFGGYKIALERFRTGRVPLSFMTKRVTELQEDINEMLGRDPESAPPVKIIKLKDNLSYPAGSILADVSKQLRDEYEQVTPKKLRKDSESLRNPYAEKKPRGIDFFRKN